MRNYKMILILLALFLSGCGLISQLKQNLKDITREATEMLQSVSDLSRTINSELENGDITNDVAVVLDGRLDKLAEILTTILEENGGMMFENLNGSVDNIFDNLRDLLASTKETLLGDKYVPDVLMQLSNELQGQINLIAGNAENLITITFGNTYLLIDKTTNSLVSLISIVLLSVGLLAFIIALLIKKGKISSFVYVLISIYTALFLAILFAPPVRKLVISSMGLGTEFEKTYFAPTVRAVSPVTFTIGEDKRITLSGMHLNKIKNLRVVLKKGGTTVLEFDKVNISNVNNNSIVLSNFTKAQSWKIPDYVVFSRALQNSLQTTLPLEQYKSFSNQVNQMPRRRLLINRPEPVRPTIAPTLAEMQQHVQQRNNLISGYANQVFGAAVGNKVNQAVGAVFNDVFKLSEGDYSIVTYDGDSLVPSSQLIIFNYPPPPVPDPDIQATAMEWTNGSVPAKGDKTSLTLSLKLEYPNQIKKQLNYVITSPMMGTPIRSEVSEGTIAGVGSNGIVKVQTPTFTVNESGNYTFNLQLDPENRIMESKESNNTRSTTLTVNHYVYDVAVMFSSFQPVIKDQLAEYYELFKSYHITLSVVAGDRAKRVREIYLEKSTTATNYPMTTSINYTHLSIPTSIQITTDVKATFNPYKILSLEIPISDMNLGTANREKTLISDQTDFPFDLKTDYYTIIGKVVVTKKVSEPTSIASVKGAIENLNPKYSFIKIIDPVIKLKRGNQTEYTAYANATSDPANYNFELKDVKDGTYKAIVEVDLKSGIPFITIQQEDVKVAEKEVKVQNGKTTPDFVILEYKY